MQLIGMLDSPYVRRSLITAKMLGIPIEHKALSVFRNFPEVHAINPLVKAPTLVLDDGELLVDSTLILQYFDAIRPDNALQPADPAARLASLRLTGIALAVCDKAVQLYYEIGLRPENLRWGEWITRVTGQLRDSAAALEARSACPQGWLVTDRPSQADVTAAVAWRFTQFVLPHILDPNQYPQLADLSARAERLPEFKATDFH